VRNLDRLEGLTQLLFLNRLSKSKGIEMARAEHVLYRNFFSIGLKGDLGDTRVCGIGGDPEESYSSRGEVSPLVILPFTFTVLEEPLVLMLEDIDSVCG